MACPEGLEPSTYGFDVLIACAFNYDAHSAEFEKLGALPVLKARMNADHHMAEDLKKTNKGNLFVIFGEPDIDIDIEDAGDDMVTVRINGVDIFKPSTGEVVSSDSKDIASTPLPPAPPFLPISDPFNGALKRPTQKANS